MGMAKKYFWIRKKGSFGKDIFFNDPMPPLSSDMEKHLLGRGYISTEKHASFDSADASAFETMKTSHAILGAENDEFKKKNLILETENKDLISENVDFKNQLSELSGLDSENSDLKSRVSELEAELEDFPKNVKEANKKIKSLEKELAELTKPGGK